MSTVLHHLALWAEAEPDSMAQRYKDQDVWFSLTSKEFCDRVYWLALFFESQGMSACDILTIFSYNCFQWVHSELAAVLIGAKSAGIYPNSNSKDIKYILEHTETRFFCVKNKSDFEKISEIIPKKIEIILVFEGDASFSSKAISYLDAIDRGYKIFLNSNLSTKTLANYLERLDPKASSYVIYTSGTTGTPKAALLSNDNLVYTASIVANYWGISLSGGSVFSFLPLCHIAEKIQNLGAGVVMRHVVNYCTKFENVAQELVEVEPTLFLSVPRFWEKMMEGVLKKIHESSFFKKKLASLAFAIGKKKRQRKFYFWLADYLVFRKIRKALGLSKATITASGAAQLPAHVCQWFQSIGLEIREDFGQTESTGVICMTEPGKDSAGSVGKVVPGLEMKIADDGEILTRGRHVFQGYYKDDESTCAVLDADHWLHTGDLGEQNSQGLVRIFGRKKEVLKTSGGKMIAPLPIEEALKACSIISQVCLVGDGRRYVSAIITLTESELSKLGKLQNVTKEPVITNEAVTREIQKCVDQVNQTLSSYQQIKRFVILSKEFSILDGEMTPTLKMKRNIIEKHYKSFIDQLYLSALNE